MPGPLTVYFDTYFYVNLAAESDSVLSSAIQALDDLEVRPVVSSILLEELMKNTGDLARDCRLADALKSLKNGWLPIDIFIREPDILCWDVLKIGFEERAGIAELHKNSGPFRVLGDVFGAIARSEVTDKKQEKMNDQWRKEMRETGFDDPEEWSRWKTRNLLNQIKPSLGSIGIDLSGIQFPGPMTQDRKDFKRFSNDLKSQLPRDQVERKRIEDCVISCLLADDSRPWKTYLGKDTPKERSRLGNEMRDVRRISDFIRHSEKIEYFQLDGAQYKKIEKLGPRHPLVQKGLERRCFWAAGSSSKASISSLSQLLLGC